ADDGFRIEEPSVLITFDDGYRDNLSLALPVLRELHAPAALFVATGLLSRPRLFWWDHIAFALSQTRQPKLVLERPEPLEIDLTRTPYDEAVAQVIGAYLRAPRVEETADLCHLDERACVTVDPESLARALLLSWDDARELDRAGLSIGSHAHDHHRL